MGALRSFCLNYAGLDERPSESLPPLPSPSFRGAEEIGAYLTLRRLRCDQTRPPRHLPRGTDTSRDPRRQGLLCAARPLSLAQGRDEAGASGHGRGPGLPPGRPARFALCAAHTARAPARRALYGGWGVASTAPGPGGRCLHRCPREHRLAVRQARASAVLSVTASQKQWLMTPGNCRYSLGNGASGRDRTSEEPSPAGPRRDSPALTRSVFRAFRCVWGRDGPRQSRGQRGGPWVQARTACREGTCGRFPPRPDGGAV